jgi:hypothetical protein
VPIEEEEEDIIEVHNLVSVTHRIDNVPYATCILRSNSHEMAISATAIRSFNYSYDLLEMCGY